MDTDAVIAALGLSNAENCCDVVNNDLCDSAILSNGGKPSTKVCGCACADGALYCADDGVVHLSYFTDYQVSYLLW